MKTDTEEFFSKTYVCVAGALLCNFLWGSAFPSIKIGYELCDADKNAASEILFAGIRFLCSGVMAGVFLSIVTKTALIPKTKESAGRICVLSLFQTILQYIFFYIGLANTTGVKASVIEGSNVFMAIMVSSLIFRLEKITARKIIGSIIGFAGVILINISGLDLSLTFTGEGFILISTVAYAVSTVLIKRFGKEDNSLMLSSWQFIVGGIVLIIIGLLFGGEVHITSLSGVLILLYLAFISAAAYSLWSVLLRYNPVSKIAVYGFSNTCFGVLLSAVILGERDSAFSVRGMISLLLVCAGIYIVNKRSEEK